MSHLPPVNRPRLLTVTRITELSPGLRRLTLSSPDLADYPFTCGGAHIKIMLPRPGQSEIVLPTPTPQGPRWEDPATRPIIRTFTLRAFRREQLELDIDFALHGELGPASHFALHAVPGDRLAISGPGGPTPMLQEADNYYMAGDLTALPAICAMAEVMSPQAKGEILLLVPHRDEIQEIPLPSGVTQTWFVGEPDQTAPLVEHFIRLPIAPEASYFWFGGEEGLVLPLRQHIRRTLDVDRRRVYAVPYWRHGKSEDAYHQDRHAAMES
ncbi:siderophore-interacting protein [Aeromonas diversa]|uniref:Vibriobactin utilization protein ViuB n=1 Tax=Aeromonas diversa CDC 2478-85 TaxID=1268237 RepID=N9TWH6_9GAMM|nr:siderophore-interacting protein [Aeromonas diversa]ENY70415.1 vibriobactin utilization protein ViuB [Aeromonas diversa CDC 2478-85]